MDEDEHHTTIGIFGIFSIGCKAIWLIYYEKIIFNLNYEIIAESNI